MGFGQRRRRESYPPARNVSRCKACSSISHYDETCPVWRCTECNGHGHIAIQCRFRTTPIETYCNSCESRTHDIYQCVNTICVVCKGPGHTMLTCPDVNYEALPGQTIAWWCNEQDPFRIFPLKLQSQQHFCSYTEDDYKRREKPNRQVNR